MNGATPTPAGLLGARLYHVSATPWQRTASSALKLSFRCCLACCFGYAACVVALAFVAVVVHPLGSCIGMGELLSADLCECTCFVAEPSRPELPFYHPAAPTAEVVAATVEPDLVRDRSASLCGSCPYGTAKCRAALRAQQSQSPPSASYDVFVGRNASLRCYSDRCASEATRAAASVADDRLGTPAGACDVQRAAGGACGPVGAVAGCA
jgi:hypothetical protein